MREKLPAGSPAALNAGAALIGVKRLTCVFLREAYHGTTRPTDLSDSRRHPARLAAVSCRAPLDAHVHAGARCSNSVFGMMWLETPDEALPSPPNGRSGCLRAAPCGAGRSDFADAQHLPEPGTSRGLEDAPWCWCRRCGATDRQPGGQNGRGTPTTIGLADLASELGRRAPVPPPRTAADAPKGACSRCAAVMAIPPWTSAWAPGRSRRGQRADPLRLFQRSLGMGFADWRGSATGDRRAALIDGRRWQASPCLGFSPSASQDCSARAGRLSHRVQGRASQPFHLTVFDSDWR